MHALILAACLSLSGTHLPTSDALADAFNAAKGTVRVVMLLSPSCPECISGGDMIRNDVVNVVKDKHLTTFAVYIPMLIKDLAGGEDLAVESAKKMKEAGIVSFWDGKAKLGRAYGKTVNLPKGKKVAWDVYFVYGPEAVWGAVPPKPAFWMHQLDCDSQCLDPVKFRGAVLHELKSVSSQQK